MRKLIFVITLCLYSFTSFSQTHQYANNMGAWLWLPADFKVSPHWGFHAEIQLRRNDYLKSWQQIFVRPGINYYLNDHVFFNLSYLFLETYPYGKYPAKAAFPEHAIWESFNLKEQYGKLEWVGRAQFEQRFIEAPTLQDNVYKLGKAIYSNRFRLLNRFSIPFKGKKIVDNSFYATAFDELFINFGKNIAANIFDQNRAYAALGYKIPKVGRLEVGYMLQSILKSDGIRIENNHLIMLTMNVGLDFSKKKKSN